MKNMAAERVILYFMFFCPPSKVSGSVTGVNECSEKYISTSQCEVITFMDVFVVGYELRFN